MALNARLPNFSRQSVFKFREQTVDPHPLVLA
jgi:hypothetical protein